jgi:hypothetical protein
MIKKGKAGERVIDITELIKSAKAVYNAERGCVELKVVLSASSTQYLNPEMLVTALKEKCGILCGDPTEEHYSILRTSLKKADMSDFS